MNTRNSYFKSEVMLPPLKDNGSRQMGCVDALIVAAHTTQHIVHMGDYCDTLTLIFKCVNPDEGKAFATKNSKGATFGFDIGINTFENQLYSQLLKSVFINGVPENEFDPQELIYKYVRLVVGKENGLHLLEFRPSLHRLRNMEPKSSK